MSPPLEEMTTHLPHLEGPWVHASCSPTSSGPNEHVSDLIMATEGEGRFAKNSPHKRDSSITSLRT